MSKKTFLALCAFGLEVPATSFAAPAWTLLKNPTTKTGSTLMEFIYWLISILQLVGTPIIVCAVIYSGFLLVTTGGSEEKVSKAKLWILWTLVGAFIVLGAKTIAGIACGTAALFDATIICP